MAVIAADFEEDGDEDVVRMLVRDLAGKADEGTIRTKMVECLREAKDKLVKEG